MEYPSAEYIHNWLTYDEESDTFTWKRKIAERVKAGDVAGTRTTRGFTITIEGKRYRKAGLVWVLYFGSQPPRRMAYIDGDRYNSRPYNLKEFTPLSCDEIMERRRERRRKERWGSDQFFGNNLSFA